MASRLYALLAWPVILAIGFVLIYGGQASAASLRTLTIDVTSDFSNSSGAGAFSRPADMNTALARITSSPAGIDCGLGHAECSAQFMAGTRVTLTGSGYNSSNIGFVWRPANGVSKAYADYSVPHMHCEGIDPYGNVPGNVCQAEMPDSNVAIKFGAYYTHSSITVEKTGTGAGIVANQNPVQPPLVINCGSLCVADIKAGHILFGIADKGSKFTGWDLNRDGKIICGPSEFSECPGGLQIGPRGDGKTFTFRAIFTKDNDSQIGSSKSSAQTKPPVTHPEESTDGINKGAAQISPTSKLNGTKNKSELLPIIEIAVAVLIVAGIGIYAYLAIYKRQLLPRYLGGRKK